MSTYEWLAGAAVGGVSVYVVAVALWHIAKRSIERH